MCEIVHFNSLRRTFSKILVNIFGTGLRMINNTFSNYFFSIFPKRCILDHQNVLLAYINYPETTQI